MMFLVIYQLQNKNILSLAHGLVMGYFVYDECSIYIWS